tara:strand:+ start:9522 stop:10682 length:1161 start_codon:yes stop_codon:yes gene_type:complete
VKQTFQQASLQFQKEIAKYFPERIDEIELLFAINSSHMLPQISQNISLFLLGNPSTGKSTCLELLKSLPNILWRDGITPAALVSGTRDMDPSEMLLYQLPNRTLIIPEFAPLANSTNAKQIFANFTRLLDSNGMVLHFGTTGALGFSAAMKFNLLGAAVRFDQKTWEMMTTMGPRLVFLRLKNSKKSVSEISQQLTKISKERNYAEKLEIGRKLILAFHEKITKIYPDGLTINPEKDDSKTLLEIANLAQLLSALRGKVVKVGRDFSNETIIEDPKRVFTTLVSIARCLSFIRGRSYISENELPMIRRLVFDSAEPGRIEILKNLISHDSLSTSKLVKITGLSRATIYRKFTEFVLLGLATFNKKSGKTKPESIIILASEWDWLKE